MGNNTKKEKPSAKKIINRIINVIIWLFTLFALLITILAITGSQSPDGIPSIFGTTMMTVQSPSMEPTLMTGDLIFGKKLSDSDKSALKTGDIVTFRGWDIDGDGAADLITHRIVEVKNDSGQTTFVTKGDNNPVEDSTNPSVDDVLVIYTGTHIGGLGSFLNYLRTQNGFLLVIVLPLAALFLYELISFIVKFVRVKNENAEKMTDEKMEEIRKKAIEEYIKSQKGGDDDSK